MAPAAAVKTERRKKKKIPRNPLEDLNGCSSNSSEASSMSVKAPRGCLRFFLSPASSSKTPKSAPTSKDKRNPSSLYQCHSGKNPISKTTSLESEPKLKILAKPQPSTPLSKVPIGKPPEDNSDTKTPPVQPSVSPEIQCGSSLVSTITPACYGAGHVVSGITDKRKCRPRGLLAVGENGTPFARNEDENAKFSIIPSPIEASMHWLLSPCDEEEDGGHKNGSCQSQTLAGSILLDSPFSPSPSNGLASDTSNTTNTTDPSRKRTSFSSPTGVPEFEQLLNKAAPCSEGRNCSYDVSVENSPFSMDSLGSGNVICTPGSDSSADRYVDSLRLSRDNSKKDQFGYGLGSMADDLRTTSLAPNRLESRECIDLSFQFDSVTTSCSSVCLAQFRQILDDQSSWNSVSTMGNANDSESQMRISWREGLMSQIYEMDDCCRCLSDEEEEANVDASFDQMLAKTSWSPQVSDKNQQVEEKSEENGPPKASCSCAESISTDGGGLLASGDSDWTLSYKNELFQV
ncbi:hypothetical protein UlMin_016026 [Ulmus minor]